MVTDLKPVQDLLNLGFTYSEIVAKLGVSMSTVSKAKQALGKVVVGRVAPTTKKRIATTTTLTVYVSKLIVRRYGKVVFAILKDLKLPFVAV